MKNIFKLLTPHIVSFCGGEYGVRKLTMFGWCFYSEKGLAYSTKVQINTHCRFASVEDAEKVVKLLHVKVCGVHRS